LKAVPLEIHEEECLVLTGPKAGELGRAAERPAVIVLQVLRPAIGAKLSCVQGRVSMEPVRAPVKLVGARSRGGNNVARKAGPILRFIVRGQNGDFTYAFRRDWHIRAE